ncbi:VRR-NUC domain protein [compost metagenome]
MYETDIQQDFMDQAAAIPFQGGTVKDYVYAIPNGGYRSKKTGKTLKAEGVKKGIPDTHCFVARAPYHSLYIEFKTEKGQLRPEQEQVIAMLREQGHKVVVCRSSQSGITEILKYLGL